VVEKQDGEQEDGEAEEESHERTGWAGRWKRWPSLLAPYRLPAAAPAFLPLLRLLCHYSWHLSATFKDWACSFFSLYYSHFFVFLLGEWDGASFLCQMWACSHGNGGGEALNKRMAPLQL
jgi:hypothetical protein